MRLSFRHRLFLGLVTLGAVPLAVAIVVLAIQANSSSSPAGPRAAFDEIAQSGRDLTTRIDTAALDADGKAALQSHSDVIARRTTLARRAETLSRLSAATLAIVVLISGIGLVGGSIYLAQRWSRGFSEPIENLIGWIRRIEKGEPLPNDTMSHGTPEVESLAVALRGMASELATARQQEIEQQRLRAFREVARRVAHEIRGPLTASRLALAQMERRDDTQVDDEAFRVLRDETERLDAMAREFAEFGRLPEGPKAPIDVTDLVESVVIATVPPEVHVETKIPDGISCTGHYEPLRRALQNLIRNAIEVTDDRGVHIHALKHDEANTVEISVTDFGPGVPAEKRENIFEPYFTTKPGGTGLGLAIVKQVADAHGGVVSVSDGQTDGATFTIQIPVNNP